jgi:hypothetical protein
MIHTHSYNKLKKHALLRTENTYAADEAVDPIHSAPLPATSPHAVGVVGGLQTDALGGAGPTADVEQVGVGCGVAERQDGIPVGDDKT